MQTADFSPGGYRFIPGVFQYSGGVVASPGYRIMRIRFMTPVALAQGFRRIEVILSEFGRPTTAFCACELRSPAPFSERGGDHFKNAVSAAAVNADVHHHQGVSSTGHVKEPDPLCTRPVEHPDRLGRRLQQDLAALSFEIGFSFQ